MTEPRSKIKYPLPAHTRGEMVARSFFIQATNNFERMLSLGFLYALWPALKVAYPDAEARRRAMVRHLSFFNTQPYLANGVLGVVAHVELAERGPELDFALSSIKRAMMGAFGALGDDLFWAGLMPAAALLALPVYVWRPEAALVGLAATLVAYNVFHLWARIRLFNMSLKLGRRVTRYLKLLRLPQLVVLVKIVAAALLGVFATALVWRTVAEAAPRGGLVAAAAGGAAYLLIGRGVRPGACWYIIAAGAAAAGYWLC